MFAQLDRIEARFHQLEEMLADPVIATNPGRFQEIAMERSELEPKVRLLLEYRRVDRALSEAREILDGTGAEEELRELAAAELEELVPRQEQLASLLKLALVPPDPLDGKNILVEIRAGTGGDEAALFAAELYRLYQRFAENRRWKTEILSLHETGIGGIKEVIFGIQGRQVYRTLKFEAGTHRVQRVPVTESQGRIHTSAVTVAVLAEADDVEVDIDEKDIEFQVFRSSGPGGQSVNTTDSAVRLIHHPTGLVVSCQDEKSQHKNKAKALRVLRARLLEIELERQHSERAQSRRLQVGTGDRSGRIRTYNFPQGRVTDHRIGLTLYRLAEIMEGDIDELVERLIQADQEAKLALLADA